MICDTAPVTRNWLPADKTAAVCFSIDDVHPGTSQDPYEAGGDLASGALGRLVQLQRRHDQLKFTLCVTPNWRLKSLRPHRASWRDAGVLRLLPGIQPDPALERLHEPDRFRIDRYPRLVAYLNALEHCEVVLHGLTHAHPGESFAVEFQGQSVDECSDIVRRGMEIFEAAGVRFVRGFVPPAWNAPEALIAALDGLDFAFLCSARDVHTGVSPDARTHMSGLAGVSLVYPQFVGNRHLVHLSCNFQATSPIDRACAILDLGGVLHIKAHIFKSGGGHVMLDGLDELYCNYLDLLFAELHRRYGARLWWAHLSEIAARVREAA